MRRRRKKKASELTSLVDVLFILLFAALVQARGVAALDDGPPPIDDPPDAAAPGDAGVDASPGDGGADRDAGEIGDAMIRDASVTDATLDGGPPDDGESYRARSLEIARTMASAVGSQPVAIVELTTVGQLTAMAYWRDGREIRRDEMSYPLLYRLSDEDGYEIDYRGKLAERHRLCAIVRDHFTGTGDPASAQDSPDPEGHRDGSPGTGPAAPGVVTSADISEMVVLLTLDAPDSELPWGLRRGLESDMKSCFNDFRGVAIMITP